MLIILTEVKALFLNGGQYAHPATRISRISTEKLTQKVSNYFRGTLPRKHPEKLTSSGVRSNGDLLPHKWIWLYKSKNLYADHIGCFSLTETNLVLSSCRRIISEPHSLPGLLPDCAGFWELLLSNSSCFSGYYYLLAFFLPLRSESVLCPNFYRAQSTFWFHCPSQSLPGITRNHSFGLEECVF